MLTPSTISDFNELSIGEERLSPIAFVKRFTKFRTSDLSPRFKPLPEDFQLPVNSIVHLFDNMYNRDNGLELKDAPYLNIPFIKHDPFRKYLYHVIHPNVNESLPIQLPKDFVLRNAGLNMNLMKFRKTLGSTYRFLSNLEQIPPSQNTLTVLNYNPLFRVFTRGILPIYRQFKVILGTILNTASKIEDKRQFIVVPLSHQIYQRDKFRLAETKETTSSIRSQNSFHYFFMMHWLNFISTTTDLSLFESYPTELWDSTSIIFTVGLDFKYGMVWSLKDAIDLNQGNKLYIRYINQINALVLADTGTEITDEEHVDDVEVQITQKTEEKKLVTETTGNTVVTTKTDESVLEEVDELEEDTSMQENEDDNLHEEIKKELTKSLLPAIISSVVPNVTPTKTVAPSVVNVEPVVVEEEPVAVPILPTYAPEITDGHIPKIQPHTTSTHVAEAGAKYLDDTISVANTLIKEHPNLTPKQKQRLTKLLEESKQVKFNGKTVEHIVTTPVDPSVTTSTVEHLEGTLTDPSMLHSSIQSFDDQYMKTCFDKDLVSIALSMSTSGLILTDIDEQLHSDELNRVRKFKFTYEDLNGKTHSVKFDVPHIAEDSTCLVNGIKCVFRKQMTNLPICKVSPTRVSLSSNYNKTIVERNEAKAHNFLAYIQRMVAKINFEKTRIHTNYGSHVDKNERYPYEYSQLASLYTDWELNDDKSTTKICFDYPNRFTYSKYVSSDKLLTLEKKYGIFLGEHVSNKKEVRILFISISNIITVFDIHANAVAFTTTFLDMLSSIYNVVLSSRLSEWTDIKILDKKFPVGILLGYRFGLMHLLSYLKCKYRLEPKRTRLKDLNSTDIVIPFSDKILILPRYPLRNSLIIAGFLMFDTNNYLFEDFEFKDVYYQILTNKGYRTNYLKGIDDTFDLFVDPCTRDVLVQMGEPTTFKDLLIRATDMLVVEKHEEAASMANHRLRSFERINAIVYNEIAREFTTYRRKSGKGQSFSINPNAIMQRILQDQAMQIVEDINPIHELKTNTGFTYTGAGGRTSQSFVVNDRRYPDDAVGIISESTPDSGSVAITAIASANPTIVNTRGMLSQTKPEDLDPTQLLSPTSLLMPGVTQDDRANSSCPTE